MRTRSDDVIIRPISAADLDLEEDFVGRLSSATGYQRLMSTRRPSLEELRRFTDIDPQREMALIAIVVEGGRERQVGVARYVKDERTPWEAEFAIVLADDWQEHGLGKKLLASLLDAARSAGVKRIVGTTLTSNERMLALARKMGFDIHLHPASATISLLTLQLDGGK